jgi:methyl-accepting chemotaxis protein
MYFFDVFAMLAAYMDWRPIAISAGVAALHHLILDVVVPGTAFPEEGLDRVMLHALAVVAECGVLLWLTFAVNRLFARIEEANELVEFTARETAKALEREMQVSADLRRDWNSTSQFQTKHAGRSNAAHRFDAPRGE